MRRTLTYSFALVLASDLLTACVSASELDGRLGTWVGEDADALASAWGAPYGTYQKKDGGKILSYELSSVITTGTSSYADTTSRFCRIDFTVAPDNKIASFAWRGATEQCDKLVLPHDLADDTFLDEDHD